MAQRTPAATARKGKAAAAAGEITAPPPATTSTTADDAKLAALAAAAAAAPRQLVDLVHRWLLDGNSDNEIRDAIDKHRGKELPADVDAEPLIFASMTRFKASAGCDTELLYGWVLEAYRDIYRAARDSGDLKEARACLTALVKLTRA